MRQRSRRTKGMEEAHPFAEMSQVNQDAAGVDIGAEEIVVCVPGAGNTQIVKAFGNYTLEAVKEIEKDNERYRVLDPAALLKAKAANVRGLDQSDRHDRAHLQIIAQCVAPFLRDAHQQAVGEASLQGEFAKTISRTFRTLSDRQTLNTLLAEGIQPLVLLPVELKDSPIEKVRSAFEHQMPRLNQLIQQASS